MSQDLEKVTSRLENIQKVKPILTALRTISLGSWQMARNRRAGLQRYTHRLLDLLPWILPHIVERRPKLRLCSRGRDGGPDEGPVIALVIGSERGLCGRYNSRLLERFDRYQREQADAGREVKTVALGSRLLREMASAGYETTRSESLSMSSLPSYDTAAHYTSDWLEAYESYELSAVDVLYNADRGAGTYESVATRLIPPEMPPMERGSQRDRMGVQPIVETDPMRLYVHIVTEWTAITLYRLFLEAAQTVHLARFQLMESATQNADRLVDELTLTVQSARRQAITREMQELAVGAGLLGGGSS
ncbi:MAG: F0F1 ATP synthase subunit gamma [Anaerolineae bacterium]